MHPSLRSITPYHRRRRYSAAVARIRRTRPACLRTGRLILGVVSVAHDMAATLLTQTSHHSPIPWAAMEAGKLAYRRACARHPDYAAAPDRTFILN
jgi:hypothetical protein